MLEWIIELNNTDKIALVALVIAIYGAVLSTILAINECFQIKLFYLHKCHITLSKKTNSLNDHGEYHDTYCKSSYTIAILVRITNNSKNPTTINDFILNDKYLFNSLTDKEHSVIATGFKYFRNYLTSNNVIFLEKKLLQPLIELQPLTTQEGYIIFSGLTDIPNKLKITINCVQKKKSFKLKLSNINDYRNNILDEKS